MDFEGLSDLLHALAGAVLPRQPQACYPSALQEFIARREQRKVLDLMGKLEWDKSFDYKAERWRS